MEVVRIRITSLSLDRDYWVRTPDSDQIRPGRGLRCLTHQGSKPEIYFGGCFTPIPSAPLLPFLAPPFLPFRNSFLCREMGPQIQLRDLGAPGLGDGRVFHVFSARESVLWLKMSSYFC